MTTVLRGGFPRVLAAFLAVAALEPPAAAETPEWEAAKREFQAARAAELAAGRPLPDATLRLVRCAACSEVRPVTEVFAAERVFASYREWLNFIEREVPRSPALEAPSVRCPKCGKPGGGRLLRFLYARMNAWPRADFEAEGVPDGRGGFHITHHRLRRREGPERLFPLRTEDDYRKAFGSPFSARDAWAEILALPPLDGLVVRKIESGYWIMRWPVVGGRDEEAERQRQFYQRLLAWEGGRPPDEVFFLRELWDRELPYAADAFDQWLGPLARPLSERRVDGLALFDSNEIRLRIASYPWPAGYRAEAPQGERTFQLTYGGCRTVVPIEPLLERAAFTGCTLGQALAREMPRRIEELRRVAGLVAILRKNIPEAKIALEDGRILTVSLESGARGANLASFAWKLDPNDPRKAFASLSDLLGFDAGARKFRDAAASLSGCFCGRRARVGAILRRQADLDREFGARAKEIASTPFFSGIVQVYTLECQAGHVSYATSEKGGPAADEIADLFDEEEGPLWPSVFSVRAKGDVRLVTGHEAAAIVLRPAALGRFLDDNRFPRRAKVHLFAPFADALAFAPRPLSAEEANFVTRLAREEIARSGWLRESRLGLRTERPDPRGEE